MEENTASMRTACRSSTDRSHTVSCFTPTAATGWPQRARAIAYIGRARGEKRKEKKRKEKKRKEKKEKKRKEKKRKERKRK